MKRYKVLSGEMCEIVEAESHSDAAAKLFTMFDDCEEVPLHGANISTVEIVGSEFWHKAESALERSGRFAVSDINKAAETLDESLRQHDWFVAVGVGQENKSDVLFVYVTSQKRAAVDEQWSGWPVVVQVSGLPKPVAAESSNNQG